MPAGTEWAVEMEEAMAVVTAVAETEVEATVGAMAEEVTVR